MADKIYNKVVWGDKTLIDLTGDTIEEQYIIGGKTAHDRSGNIITGTCTYDADTSAATATADEILEGEVAYANGNEITGTMPRNENVAGVISRVDTPYSIGVGYHDGSGKVSIDSAEAEKIKPANIRDGVEILGVKGTMTGTEAIKTEPGEATPTKDGFTLVPTAGYYFTEVVVKPIPYKETANTFGTTVTIG